MSGKRKKVSPGPGRSAPSPSPEDVPCPEGEVGSARGCALRKLFDMEMAESLGRLQGGRTPVRHGCRGALVPNNLISGRTGRVRLPFTLIFRRLQGADRPAPSSPLVEQHPIVGPSDRQDVEIAIVIDVDQDCAVVMLVAGRYLV